jgi:hypothetical protein
MGLCLPASEQHAGTIAADPQLRIPYVIAGSTLYTNEPGASLEYARYDVDIPLLPPSLRRAMSLELASRLAIVLPKSRDRQGELVKAAEIQKQRAMAINFNRQPHTSSGYVSEEELARQGIVWPVGTYRGNWG